MSNGARGLYREYVEAQARYDAFTDQFWFDTGPPAANEERVVKNPDWEEIMRLRADRDAKHDAWLSAALGSQST